MRWAIAWCGAIILSFVVAVCFVWTAEQYDWWSLLVLVIGYLIAFLYGCFSADWCDQ